MIIKITPVFQKLANKMLKQDLLEELYDFLEEQPESGKIIPNSGGIRKLRWKSSTNNKGKSGGIRVLYYYHKEILIILLTLYAKSDQENIKDQDLAKLRQNLPSLISRFMEDL